MLPLSRQPEFYTSMDIDGYKVSSIERVKKSLLNTFLLQLIVYIHMNFLIELLFN